MIHIYVDGGSRNNQDPQKREGYGSFYVTSSEYPHHAAGRLIHTSKIEFGNITNNQAEYKTLQAALDYCTGELITKPIIHTDSELMISQLNGKYKTKNPDLKPLKEQAESDIKLIEATLVKAPREEIVDVLGH